jgi:cation transport regulator ChaC
MDRSEHDAGSEPADDWVFGYGSLIHKVDFPYLERQVAEITGWARRFWQGSHDHRGTPSAPGRVLTLVPSPGTICRGMAYRIAHEVYEHLDDREKNGYERHRIRLHLIESGRRVDGTLYVAAADNPAFLGEAPIEAMAEQIHRSVGPSGSNRDYLVDLAQALRDIGEDDEHVFELERHLPRRA